MIFYQCAVCGEYRDEEELGVVDRPTSNPRVFTRIRFCRDDDDCCMVAFTDGVISEDGARANLEV